jgi:hypothetical protein
LAALALLAMACTPPPEYPLLQQFFSASRLRDLTALHDIATVVFDPRDQGVVTDFTITTVTPGREGNRELKDVTVSAAVRAFAGETIQKTLLIRLERLGDRWMVTQIR